MLMKKSKIIIVLIILIFICFYNYSYSQIVLQAGGGVGLTIPEGDFSGNTMDFYSGKNFGLGSGLDIHAKAKAGILGFLLYGQINYSSLSNNGYAVPGQGNVDISQKVLSFRIGPEFDFDIPASPITPYLDGNVGMNIFSGNVTFQGVPDVPNADYVIESASRFGIGLGGGVLFKLNPLMHLDIGLHYNFMNFLGKNYKDVNPLINQRLDSYLALNDDKDPAYNSESNIHIIGNSRSVNTLELTATLLFGI